MYVNSNYQMATDIFEDDLMRDFIDFKAKTYFYTGEEDMKKMFSDHLLHSSYDPDFGFDGLAEASLNFEHRNDFLECVKYDDLELEDSPDCFTMVSPKTFQTIQNNFLECESSFGMVAPLDNCWLPEINNIILNKITEFSENDQPPDVDLLDVGEDCGLSDEEDSKSWFDGYSPQNVKSEPTPTSRITSHLEFDHCYSAPPKEEVDDDTFNSSPCSPASSSCSEVDVETIPTQTVPKLMLKTSPLHTEILRKTPLKRGRKPSKFKQNKRTNTGKQRSKNSQMRLNPKVLTEAIKKQNYITKSGRTSKISNSVETTPSSSAPSSLHSSRCSSDSEDAVDKRASHNMAERNRRQELCNLFQELRKAVPATKRNPKASKVLILNSARDFVRQIREAELQKQRLKAELEKKMNYLKSLTENGGSSS